MIEFGDLVQDELAFGAEHVVPLPQSLGERVIGFGILGLGKHIALLASQLRGRFSNRARRSARSVRSRSST